MSTGFSTFFNILNGVQLILTIFFSWLFIWQLQLGLMGFSMVKFACEVFLVLLMYIAWKRKGLPESYFSREERFVSIFKKENRFLMKEYFKLFAKCASQNYLDYIGWEILTGLLGAYGDQPLLAAWVSMQNIMTITYNLGAGCGTSIRTFVGFEIGRENYKTAKRLAIYSIFWALFIGIIWAVIMAFCASALASVFTQVESNKQALINYLVIFAGITPVDVIWPCFVVFYK